MNKAVQAVNCFYWIFIHDSLQKYIVLQDEELGDRNTIRWDLYDEGFELLWDSANSRKEAVQYMQQYYPAYTKFSTITVPVSFREACTFVNEHHRHHVAPQGMKFSIALSNGQKLIGVLIAGRPVSRHRDNGRTLEVTRLCVNRAYKHTCSQLYATARRIARELGYQQIITYTLEEESGASLRAAGFQLTGINQGGSWDCSSRKRSDKHPIGRKRCWSLTL
ncbi:MAG: XF1762 family protein [Candidatus Pristimantibacillus sp.]